MHNPSPRAPLSWPELPDEAAVALQSVLHDFVMLFESHYLGQIERYYHERSREHLVAPDFVQPDLFRSAYPDAMLSTLAYSPCEPYGKRVKWRSLSH